MIEFRMLGTVALARADGAPLRSLLAQPRRLALFAYLAASSRGPCRRDHLLPLFWPELDQSRARAALRQALHVLRGDLGADALLSHGDEEIELDRNRVRVDVVEFERAIAAGQAGQALDLYRGDLLEGFFIPNAPEFERWLEVERARLREAAVGAARAMMERSDGSGDPGHAAHWGRQALRLAPYDEGILRRLVDLLDRSGDRAGALAAYQEFAQRLARDFEASPAAETQALVRAVRARQDAAPDAPLGSAEGTASERAAALAKTAPPERARAPFVSGPESPPARVTRPHRTWSPALMAGVAVIALGLLVIVSLGTWGGRLRRGAESSRIGSLAVLPLRDASGDTSLAALAEGMTMALSTALGEVPQLQVSSRYPAEALAANPRPEWEIGESLGVDAVVEGGVQQLHDSLRVDLQLVETRTGTQLWAHHFEERAQDRFVLEDDMSRGILSALGRPVTATAGNRQRRRPTADLGAYDLYLRGKVRARHEDAGNDSAAIVLLEQSVARDPSFAAAFAELSHAYGLRANQFAPGDTEARLRAAVDAARALDLDPELAEAHFARAFLLWSAARRFPHELVVQEDRRALALNPNLSSAHQHLGQVYLHIGLLDSAIAELREALALDPDVAQAEQRIGLALVYQGKYEEGLRWLQQVPPDFNPALWHYQVSLALLYLGRDSEALQLIEPYLRTHPRDPGGLVTANRAILEARRGDSARAEADIREAIRKGTGYQHFHHTDYSIAMAYAQLHQPAEAVRFLRMAADSGLPCYPCFQNDPYLADLSDDPGFVAFMRQSRAQWEAWQRTLFADNRRHPVEGEAGMGREGT